MADPDFNLLRVFDMIMEQRSVTRSAERLNLTQSAVSHALGRLRAMLDDPLFVRSPGGLRPTPRAEEIAPGIRDGLNRLRGALSPGDFSPARATRRFTLATSSYVCGLLAPGLAEHLRIEAPDVTLRFVPITETIDRALDRGTVDLVLGGGVKAASRFVAEPLFEEELVWIAATGNPLAGVPFDPNHLASLPQVVISIPRPLDMIPAIDDHLAQIFPTLLIDSDRGSDDPRVTVFDSQTAIAVVAGTDSVAMVPLRLAMPAVDAGRIVILSAGVVATPLSMLWHRKQQFDAALMWLRATIRTCLS